MPPPAITDDPADVSPDRARTSTTALAGFALLFAALYGAYGSEAPFFPAFLQDRGLSVERIGMVLGAGTAIKILAAPVGGWLADRSGATPATMAGFAGLTALAGLLMLGGSGIGLLLGGVLLWSAAIAPLAPLADALALEASRHGDAFVYGWVRAVGSGAFVAAALLAGSLTDRIGLPVIIWLSGALFGSTALAAMRIKPRSSAAHPTGAWARPFGLLRDPTFRRVLLVAALVLGSHAMSDAVAVIHWRQAGLSGSVIGLLWSAAVVAEIGVFSLVGPWALARLGPGACAAIAATAGLVRWSVVAVTTEVPSLMMAQSLHGLSFALLHLSAMQAITRSVAPELAATAQGLYGAVAIRAAGALVTTASGWIYAHLDASAFWIMAGLCAMALPLAPSLGPAAAARHEVAPDTDENSKASDGVPGAGASVMTMVYPHETETTP